MNLAQLMQEAKQRNIHFSLDGEKLSFKAPSGAMDAEFKAHVLRLKPDLIALLADNRPAALNTTSAAAGGSASAALDSLGAPRPAGQTVFPLSFAQQRLWFIAQMEESSQYNVPTALRLQGELNRDALQAAMQAIVQRHEILRTRYENQDGEAVQIVCGEVELPLQYLDLRHLRGQDQDQVQAQEQEVRMLAQREASQAFDLRQPLMLRASLLCLAQNEHVLLVTMHHIASDAWSMAIIVRELGLLYQAYSTGQSPNLPALSLQYADFAAWQRRHVNDEKLQAQLQYWQQQLSGLPQVHSLPLDFPRPSLQQFAGDMLSDSVPAEVLAGLRALAKQHDATLFMLLQSAFALLLARFSNQTDIVIGSPIAGRNHKEVEGLVGFFVNTLVLRSQLQMDASFHQLLARTKLDLLNAYAQQSVPFEKLVDVLKPERSLAHAPLFQIMFSMQSNTAPASEAHLQLAGLQLAALGGGQVVTKFDLELSANESAQGLQLAWNYATSLFQASTIARMRDSFGVLLRAIVAQPELAIGQLPIVTERDLAQFAAWNAGANAFVPATWQPYPGVHTLFETAAAAQPEAIALQTATQSMSYAAVEARANQIAHALLAAGIEAENLVGLCLPRGFDMICAMLGIWKAGAAYVPIDPAYPAERLAHMLHDSQVKVLLTHQAFAPRLQAAAGKNALQQVLCLDQAQCLADCASSKPMLAKSQNSQLAYVLYTSGSTGLPKGVMIEHRQLLGHAHAAQTVFALQPSDRALMFSNLCVDAALELPLCVWQAAARLVLREEILPLPHAFLQSCVQQGVTIADLPPAYLMELSDAALWPLWQQSALRQMLVGGEAFPAVLLKQWQAMGMAQRCRLINAYGPTETTITASLSVLDCEHSGPITIGAPLAGRAFSVLDAHGMPVPIGVAGELTIAGPCLARGYWQQAALTAEKFVTQADGVRRYRTGDTVRWTENGEIVFVGRLDEQVKVRGFRVELGEIEACISQHPSVKEALVMVKGEGQYLLAYLLPQQVQEANAPANLIESLRQFLQQRLADFMLPSAFVVLPAWPLMANGKIDRRALPTPDLSSLHDYTPPSSATEVALAQIWAEVLKLKQVSITASFFELGGHSLLAMRMLGAVAAKIGVTLSVRELFEHKTIAQLARVIQGQAAESSHSVAASDAPAPIPRVARQAQMLPSFAQQRLWFIEQLEKSSQYNIPTALRLTGQLQRAALQQAFDEILRRHEVLRTIYCEQDGECVQVIQAPRPFPLQEYDLSELSGSAQEQAAQQLAREESARSFDLAQDLMLRASLIHLSAPFEAPGEYVLLVTMHHIASDGWSMGIIVREFAALYSAFCQQQANPLPELTLQYADFAAWQRGNQAQLEQDIAYWQQHLANLPALHGLPVDKIRPAQQQFVGAVLPQRLPSQLLHSLQQLANAQDATLFMLLHSAFALLLARYSNETDIVIGSPIAGRTRHELEGVVGLFVNTLVLRSQLSLQQSFISLLQRGKADLLDAYAHQDVPFEKLVDVLKPERSLAHTPLFQIMFSLQNTEQSSLNLPGLVVGGMSSGHVVSKFDLELSAGEVDGGLLLTWNYATSVFEAASIARMAESFAVLLEAILATPHRAVGELDIVSRAERQQLAAWNATQFDYHALPEYAEFSSDVCFPEIFQARAASHPLAPALRCNGVELNYQQLNARANQVAHKLLVDGVQVDSLVGLYTERSLEMVIGMLGIMKAGAAYVPLDPSYPKARLEYMLANSGVQRVLTQSHLLPNSPIPAEISVCLDDAAIFADFSSANLPRERVGYQPNNLAYVIYTSGSTGQPKGVMIEHAGLLNRIQWMQQEYQMRSSDRVLQKTPFSFDVSVWELTWPFMVGACLVMAKPEGHKEPDYLADLIVAEQISILHFVPSMLAAMLDSGRWQECSSVRQVFCSGEALPYAVLRQFQDVHQAELHNLYGPTEASIDVSYWMGRSNYPRQIVPIGRPIANVALHVLNPAMGLTPIGVAGELHISGICLARGYRQRDDLTAEKFIYQAVDGQAPQRLYKTGDIARFLPDGNLEYMGRIDHQVKLRGLRIELGEIENQLQALAEVKEAAVMARGQGSEMRLVAYVVAQNTPLDEAGFIQTLQAGLRGKLPDYMVPADFLILPQFPLSANGKLDRKLLPDVDHASRVAAAYIAPANAIEEELCQLWASLLKLERVGVEDSYFAIGGDSIKAITLVARLKKAGYTLTVRDVFVCKTVRALAALLAGTQSASAAALEVAPFAMLSQAEMDSLASELPLLEDAYPLTLLQQGMVLHSQLEEAAGAYHDVMNVQVKEPLHLAEFEQALLEMVTAHGLLRTVYAMQGERPLQLVYRQARIYLDYQDLAKLDANAQRQHILALVESERHSPIVFEKSLWKIILRNLGEGHFQFIFSFHHSMLDGWSIASFNTELFNRYLARLNRQASPQTSVPALPYRYYVAQEQRALQDEAARAYWQNVVSEARLPWWLGQHAVRQHTRKVVLGSQLSGQLAALAKQLGVQDKSVLQAAHVVMMGFLAAQDDVMTSVVANGRPEMEGADLTLGLFLNSLPLRVNLQGHDWHSLVRQIEQTSLAAQAFNHYPLAAIVAQAKVDLSASLFNYTSFHIYESMGKVVDAHVQESHEINNYLFSSEFAKGIGADKALFYLSLKLDAGQFDAAFADRLAVYYQHILQQLADSVTPQPIRSSAFFAADEWQTICQLAQGTSQALPQPTVAQMFVDSAARYANQIALVDGERQLRYAELEAETAQLANTLRALGVGPNVVVAVAMARSHKMVLALLAIMRAGGAYLPLDPQHPAERLQYMLQDSAAAILLSDTELAADSPLQAAGLRHFSWQQLRQAEQDLRIEGSQIDVADSADRMAYLIYTSGSTGQPKGVVIGTQAMAQFIRGASQRVSLDQHSRWLAVTTISFDIAGFELFGPLSHGGCLHLVSSEAAKDAQFLASYIQREQINLMQATPATWWMLLETGWQGEANLLGLAGGEALSADFVRAMQGRCGRGLMNCYGPTEATIWSHIAPVLLQDNKVVLHGLLPGYGHCVVDQQLRPVPQGVPGELMLGGGALAQGYWQRAEMTAEKFVSQLPPELGVARLYRTGDLVRRQTGDQLDFLGRLDDQVKIRGYRIELGEIENRLRAIPAVSHAVVIASAMPGNAANKRLLAYLVLAEPMQTAEIGLQLARELPDYMLPSAYIVLDALPLTPNGKVNKKALPAPDVAQAGALVAASTATEVAMCAVWQRVLQMDSQRDSLSVTANFFEIGGDSLLATKLLVQINHQFGSQLSIRDVFSLRTVRELSLQIDFIQAQTHAAKAANAQDPTEQEEIEW